MNADACICVRCGAWYPEPPAKCLICTDEREAVAAGGQQWTSAQELQANHRNVVRELEPGLSGIVTSPAFAIAQQMHLVETPAGNLLWNSNSLVDDDALHLILQKRKDKLRSYFDELAGRFGRNYVPGRSWKGLAEMFLKLLPPMVIADLGAGEGTLSLMLAQGAQQVIAVDNSEKMVEYASDVAERNGVKNLEYRLGDLEELPLRNGEADLALFHQSLHHALHPQTAVNEAHRILQPGGRIVVVDLLQHRFEEAREMYADVWLGFSELELVNFLKKSGFGGISVNTVHREETAPHFETLLAIGQKG